MNKILKIILIQSIIIMQINAYEIIYNKDFIKRLSTSRGLYTIRVGYLQINKLGAFINRNIPDGQYSIIKDGYKYKVIYGIYNSKTETKKVISRLFLDIKNNVKIEKINYSKQYFKNILKANRNTKSKYSTINIPHNTNLYKSASKKSKIIKKLKRTSHVRVYKTNLLLNSKYQWYKIDSGWVNTPYLNKSLNTNINKSILKPSKKIEKQNVKIIKTNKAPKKNEKQNIKIIKKDKVNIKISKKKKKRKLNTFIGLSVGYAYMDAKQEKIIGDIPLNSNIDKNGININLEAGMRTKNYIYTLNYTNLLYDDVKFDRFLFGFNRLFAQNKYTTYIGLLAGISYIKITKPHFNTSIPKAMGKEFAYGIQGGLEYKLSNNLSLHSYLRYLRANHTTVLKSNPALAKINRDNHIDLNIGLRYNIY